MKIARARLGKTPRGRAQIHGCLCLPVPGRASRRTGQLHVRYLALRPGTTRYSRRRFETAGGAAPTPSRSLPAIQRCLVVSCLSRRCPVFAPAISMHCFTMDGNRALGCLTWCSSCGPHSYSRRYSRFQSMDGSRITPPSSPHVLHATIRAELTPLNRSTSLLAGAVLPWTDNLPLPLPALLSAYQIRTCQKLCNACLDAHFGFAGPLNRTIGQGKLVRRCSGTAQPRRVRAWGTTTLARGGARRAQARCRTYINPCLNSALGVASAPFSLPSRI